MIAMGVIVRMHLVMVSATVFVVVGVVVVVMAFRLASHGWPVWEARWWRGFPRACSAW